MTTHKELVNTTQVQGLSFTCNICHSIFAYQYYGDDPPFCSEVQLKEHAYVSRDPFTFQRQAFLVLGGTCCICNADVCVASKCSMFYTQRFCLDCAREHQCKFPDEIQAELAKQDRKKPWKSCFCYIVAAITWQPHRWYPPLLDCLGSYAWLGMLL